MAKQTRVVEFTEFEVKEVLAEKAAEMAGLSLADFASISFEGFSSEAGKRVSVDRLVCSVTFRNSTDDGNVVEKKKARKA